MKKIFTIYIRKGLKPRVTGPMTLDAFKAALVENAIPLADGKTLMVTNPEGAIIEYVDAPNQENELAPDVAQQLGVGERLDVLHG